MKISRMLLPALVALTGFASAGTPAAQPLDLSGTWQVELDRADVGRAEKWFARPLTQSLHLPGSLEDARLGDAIAVETAWTGAIIDRSWFTAPEYAPYRQPGNIKVPFWLQPETHYTGAAWYQRSIEIPETWKGRRIVLTLERPHWTTTVWLDGREIGSDHAISVPHVYDLGAGIEPGRHRLTVCVDNRVVPDIGVNSHSVSDHTQGNWNGVVGRLELTATEPVWIDELVVDGRVSDRTAVVRGRLGRLEGRSLPEAVRLVPDGAGAGTVRAKVDANGAFAAEVPFARDAALWDEFSPALHRITASLDNGETRAASFGFRELGRDGRQLLINGRKLFLRGTLDCAIFPKTGHPPTDLASWRKEFDAVKAHGLNHVRFHSWCPPEAAFEAADAAGVYLQIEVASWPNWSTTLGDGKAVDGWLEAETGRILRTYGNHPCFILLCAGNEPGGEHYAAWLSAWLKRRKAEDPRRLYTAGSGWPQVPENDLHVTSDPRIQQWGAGLASRINAEPPETRTDYADYIGEHDRPIVSHEIGQWCVYPNFAEMPKYTGYLKPRNFEIFQASLAAHGMKEQAHDFLIASGKLQALCYKEDIESALRTDGMGGFQLLGLQDFPGQGTALVGVLDPFWEEKGYISPEAFRRFCNATVPLARLDKRIFTIGEHLSADLEVAHFGPAPLPGVAARWRLVADDGRTVASGELPRRDLAIGAGQSLGHVDLPLDGLSAPARYRLAVELEGTPFANDWDVWVYPKPDTVVRAVPAGVTVVSRLDAAARARLDAGETVWLMAARDRVRPDPKKGPIALGFSSIFWNTAWTSGQAPHTLGILCDPRHPALAGFPTEGYSNWQWWYPLRHAAPMLLDGLPRDLHPIVQVIDDWFTNRKLGLVFEARVGKGRLLVTSIDLGGSVLDPVRRQLRASLLAYAASAKFQPTAAVTADQVEALFISR